MRGSSVDERCPPRHRADSTLDAYFAAGGNHARAKEALHVHVGTVVQRLEWIGSLLGEDWASPARSLEIQLALRVHRLRGQAVFLSAGPASRLSP